MTVIFWGGASHVDSNTSGKGLSQVMNFLKRNQHTTTIIISVPYRFDQKVRSSINEEIMNYNRKLKKLVKIRNGAHMINATCDRHFFTQHGLHLNVKGKKIRARKLIEAIPSVFDKCELYKSVTLLWKNDPTKQTNTYQVGIGNSDPQNHCEKAKGSHTPNTNLENCESKWNQTKRQRICLKVKSEDFLWN
jgi:hypothetical protein